MQCLTQAVDSITLHYMKVRQIRIEDADELTLKTVATIEDRSVNYAIRQAIKIYLQQKLQQYPHLLANTQTEE